MLRLATIGTSWITADLAAAASATGRVELVASHSRDRARAAEFANANGFRRGVSSLPELFSDDVDAIYVASPNSEHFEQVRAALEAGKHVLAEKPLTPTAAQTAALFELASRRGVVLLEAMRSAYDPGMAKVRELLPRLGAVRGVHFRMIQRSSRYDLVLAGERTNVFDPALAGGALLDIGVYCVHPLVALFGEPDAAALAEVTLPTGADGAGEILAAYPGFTAELAYSKITASALPSEIQGELGTLSIDFIPKPRRLELTTAGGTEEFEIVGATNNLLYEVERFCDLVAGLDSAEVDTQNSLRTARLLDRARESIVGGPHTKSAVS